MENLSKAEILVVKQQILNGEHLVLKFSHSLEMYKHMKDCMVVDYVDDEGNIHGIWLSNEENAMIIPLQDIYEKLD